MTPKLAEIERRAIEAQSLPSFPINVEEIRRTIEALLSQFGKGGIFDEYTVHSFDHVYEMLRSLEWLVPADTSQLLTLADWLLLTLSCYFHDLGLLVTKDEFASRDLSNFREFTERFYLLGQKGLTIERKSMNYTKNNERNSCTRSSCDTIMPGACATGSSESRISRSVTRKRRLIK
jgi:hypothetical protein